MIGINKKITVMKRFCEKVLLFRPCKIVRLSTISLMQKTKELKSADNKLMNLVNQIFGKTILPKIGDKGKIHELIMLLLYHILFGKPFEIVDMMFEKMENNHRYTTKRIPYASYIMLLINHATEEKFLPESGGNDV